MSFVVLVIIEPMDTKTKIILTFALILIGLGIILIIQSQNLGKLRIIFCDVGQGDGMLIISPDGHQAVVDAGAGTKMADCLSKYMPFWDRTIELALPTHAHQEHMEGFVQILAAYNVKAAITTGVANTGAQFYDVWQKALASEHSKVYAPNMGQLILLDPSSANQSPKLEVLWPDAAHIEKWKKDPPADLNDTSIVMRLTYGEFCAYLTGDLPKEILELLVNKHCQVLKVVHHGSKTGTNEKILNDINPQLAVIQVGANNKFGHPNKEVTDLLLSKGVKTYRNDTNGIIEIDTDGKSFKVKVEKSN